MHSLSALHTNLLFSAKRGNPAQREIRNHSDRPHVTQRRHRLVIDDFRGYEVGNALIRVARAFLAKKM